MLRKSNNDISQLGDTYNDCSKNPFAGAEDESGSDLHSEHGSDVESVKDDVEMDVTES
jgi:hypothetical protein